MQVGKGERGQSNLDLFVQQHRKQRKHQVVRPGPCSSIAPPVLLKPRDSQLVDTACREGVGRLVWGAASLRLLPAPTVVFYKHLKEQVSFFWSFQEE